MTFFLDPFSVVLLDMNSTFMFGDGGRATGERRVVIGRG
jgi:hypothetical protein